MSTPLAWKNLTSSFGKCALASTGVGFAVVLMFMQIGFWNALIDNNVQIFSLVNTREANLAIFSKSRYNASTEQRFSRRLFEQAVAVEGIEDAFTLTLDRGTAKVKVAGQRSRPIRVIGIDLVDPKFFADADLYARLSAADRRGAALLDVRSKSFYGFATTAGELAQQRIELNDQALPVVELFSLGTDFGNDGTLLMSGRMHGKFFPWRSPQTGDPRDLVDIGFLKANVSSPQQLDALAAQIQELAPQQIIVEPTEKFIEDERRFWASATPVGKIFMIGTIMGLVVGAIICYQIQFTDITEHMPEFATLKAMGYGPGYFWSVILCQSFYLACLGFLPGAVISLGLYWLLSEFSGLVMSMTGPRVLLVWTLTLAMCVGSGVLAIRKLFSTDPASLF